LVFVEGGGRKYDKIIDGRVHSSIGQLAKVNSQCSIFFDGFILGFWVFLFNKLKELLSTPKISLVEYSWIRSGSMSLFFIISLQFPLR